MKTRTVTPKYEASDPESSYDIPGAILIFDHDRLWVAERSRGIYLS